MKPLRTSCVLFAVAVFCNLQNVLADTEATKLHACKFECSATVSVPAVNPEFGPIKLPAGASIRGLSLSGSAALTQVGTAGATTWRGRKVEWAERYELERGCALVSSTQPILVGADHGTAFINKGTTAIVHRDRDSMRFANLTDHHQGGMTVVFGKYFIALDPGFELVLVKSGNRNPKAIAIQEGIGWRDLKQMETDGYSVFAFRVYGPDMLKKCHIYKELNESALESDHRIRDELVRTVAALDAMFNKKNGPYHVDDPFNYGPGGDEKQTARAGNGA